MGFGTLNVTNLYKSGSLTTVAKELERYKLYLVGVQKFGWEKVGMVRAVDYIFAMEKERNVIHWE
jgi:hypothetical protein